MGLTPTFTIQSVRAITAKKVGNLNKAIIMRLSRLGEMCVNKAKSSDQYKDRTGNLRSSVGYVIVHNGKIVNGKFGVVKDGSYGMQQGQSLAYELAARNTIGFALIVVAGMNYALYVEATGRDVLTTAEQFCKREIKPMMKQLFDKVK